MMVFKPQTFYGEIVDPADPEASPALLAETRVAEALARAADIDATNVSVTAVGSTVVLQGTVALPEEVAIAADIATRASGVVAVDNRLSVATEDPTKLG